MLAICVGWPGGRKCCGYADSAHCSSISTCNQIEVKLILRAGTGYRVFWGDQSRDPLLACAQVLTPRVAFVRVPQPVGNVEFVRITPTPPR